MEKNHFFFKKKNPRQTVRGSDPQLSHQAGTYGLGRAWSGMPSSPGLRQTGVSRGRTTEEGKGTSMTKHLGGRLKRKETEGETQDGQDKATVLAQGVERLALQAPARPRFGSENRAGHVVGSGVGEPRGKRGHRHKGRSGGGRAHTTQQTGRARAGHFGELGRGPSETRPLLRTERGGCGRARAERTACPSGRGARCAGRARTAAAVPPLPVLPPRGSERAGQGGASATPHRRRRGRSGGRGPLRSGREGREGGLARRPPSCTRRRARAPRRAAARLRLPMPPSRPPAREGSPAAAAGVGGGPAPLLAALTGGGGRREVPGPPGALVTRARWWR